MSLAAQWNGILPVRIYIADRNTRLDAMRHAT
jgi:hypothetical protein